MKKSYLLEGFEPQRVLRHFEDLCGIPHGSGFEQALGDYIQQLAIHRGYFTHRDRAGNLLIHIPATPGCEQAPSLLLQGHLDMVLAKEPWVKQDLEKEPISLVLDGNILRADGTTLGADNGVGLCNMMALLDADDLRHPPLELLFTVQEEQGLVGILEFDMNLLQSRMMINMDSGDPDCMIIGAAGSAKFQISRRCKTVPAADQALQISISGLQGGHSGLEAGKNRGSAIDLAGRVLAALSDAAPIQLVQIETPGAGNSIPKSAVLSVAFPSEQQSTVYSVLEEQRLLFLTELADVDPGFTWTTCTILAEEAASIEDTRALADFLLMVPYEVSRRSLKNPAWPLCSALLSSMTYNDGYFEGKFAIRANRDYYRETAVHRFLTICRMTGMESVLLAKPIPAWPEKPDSPFQNLCLEVFRTCFGKSMTVEVEHGTVEPTIIARAIPDMDIVGFAPMSRGAHTTSEHLYLETMAPFWTLLTSVLSRLCD